MDEARIDVNCAKCGEVFEAGVLYVFQNVGMVFCDTHHAEGFVDGSIEGMDMTDEEREEWATIRDITKGIEL